MRQLWTMTTSDLRQRVRDRSVFIFGLVVPLALMFVFNLTIGSTNDVALRPITVSASVPTGDQLAATLVTALGQADAFPITVDEVSADEAGARVRAGKAQLAVVVPDGFGERERFLEIRAGRQDQAPVFRAARGRRADPMRPPIGRMQQSHLPRPQRTVQRT